MSIHKPVEDSEMRSEYDFTGAVRGRYKQFKGQGHTVIIHKKDGTITEQHFPPREGTITLAPDVMKYFPDSDSVNEALRAIIRVLPKKPRAKPRSR
jgi:hypothetical protein